MYETYYGEVESPMIQAEFDREMELKLKACKTEEEKEEVIKEYVSKRLTVLLIAFIALVVIGLVLGLIIYLFK